MIDVIFNSVEFLLGFLPVFLVLYCATPAKYRNITLLVGSILFYAFGEPVYVFLLAGSVLLNYWVGRHLAIEKTTTKKNEKKRRLLYGVMAVADVLVLCFFKWIPQTGLIVGVTGLPLGVSFYTFQILSYLTDVYRREIPPERSFVRLSTYIVMFPQLVAGPIVNYSEVSEDLKERRMSLENVDQGLKLFVAGLALKVLLADRLSLLWNQIRTVGVQSISTPYAWMGAVGYSLQLYFDFYGYSLMAVGLGRMLGFSLPENFDLPYMAKSIREFYRRWHITLGRWFQKYVYIPMGGSRGGALRTIFNLFVVWVLTSFWHGGGLHFLAWGMSLWFFIVLERLLDRKGFLEKSRVLSHCYVLLVIPLTWMCFAIPDFGELGIYFGRMFGFVEGVHVNPTDYVRALQDCGLVMAAGILLCTPISKRLYGRFKDTGAGMFALAVLFWLCVDQIRQNGNNPFLYFRF